MLFNVARKHFLMFDDGMHKKMDNFPGNLDMKDMNQVSKNASELEISITNLISQLSCSLTITS